MADPQFVGPVAPRTAPDPAGAKGRSPQQLPTDVLQQASRRLSIAAALMSVTYLVAWLLGRATSFEMLSGKVEWATVDGSDLIAVASIALSLGLWRYAGRTDCDPKQILDLGLAYMIAIAFGLGMLMHWTPMPHGLPFMPILSWIGPIMLIFAAVLPNPPGRTFVAGLLAAAMNPLAMVIARERGLWDGSLGTVVLMHYPDFLLVPVAVVISRVVRGLGLEVATAREMGSYRLGERIGLGDMGEVYEASHRMFARPAAIKLIRPDVMASGDTNAVMLAAARFRREAEAAARLRSPHTVALYDFGVTGEHTLYLVMELLDGMDLQSLVRQYGPLPANRVMYILRQVCDSLEEAHASGLVHRDIKPANIHVGRVGLKFDFVKVLDFDLVKSLDGDPALEAQASRDGVVPGTPAYMPPEALRGEAFDGRADIYALGCVAYFLLSGSTVFQAANGLEMIAKHLEDRPVPPSQRAAGAVPTALDDLILQCLEKDPEDRPAGADEVGRALRAIAIEPWTQDEAVAWWQSHARQSVAPARA